MLHVTDIKKYERCPRLFQLASTIQKERVPFIVFQENMVDLVKQRLRIQTCFEGQPNDECQVALEAMKTNTALINARFAYLDMRIKIPVMLQEDGKRSVYFTYKSCYPRESDAQYMADTLSVLELLNIQVDAVYVIHLNADYVRKDTLDVDALLVINTHLYNGKNHANHTIMDLVAMKKRDILAWIPVLKACQEAPLCPVERDSRCTKGMKCVYYDDCYPDKPEDGSILNLVASQHKYTMHDEGRLRLKEADFDRIEGTRHQYAQIMADTIGDRYVDVGALRSWIHDHVQYPISYLDFEWETFAFPPYVGMKPFDVVTFQYSLHVEESSQSSLKHHGFIGEGDCRIAFIEDLCASIPKKGTIFVFNMDGAEKLRLMQLAQQYPQYADALRQIWERMVDLSLPFSTGNVYDLKMGGYYSLKHLLSAFSDTGYEQLDIRYGLDAVEKHRQYQIADEAEKQQLYQQLEAYCAMDTYAEYVVYHALLEMAKQPVAG